MRLKSAQKIVAYKEKIKELEEKKKAKKVTVKEFKEKKEKLHEKIAQLQRAMQRAIISKDKVALKKDSKETALGTSRGSYLDCRMVISWCKSVDLSVEKLYTKALLARFAWAMDIDENFWLQYK